MTKNRSNFKMGTVEMIILFLLNKKDLYGYEITSLVEKLSEGNIGITESTLILHCTSFWETNTSQTEKYRSARDVREYIIISKRQAKNIWKNCSQNIIRIPPVSARFWPVILSTRINSNYIKRSKTPIFINEIGVFIFI